MQAKRTLSVFSILIMFSELLCTTADSREWRIFKRRNNRQQSTEVCRPGMDCYNQGGNLTVGSNRSINTPPGWTPNVSVQTPRANVQVGTPPQDPRIFQAPLAPTPARLLRSTDAVPSSPEKAEAGISIEKKINSVEASILEMQADLVALQKEKEELEQERLDLLSVATMKAEHELELQELEMELEVEKLELAFEKKTSSARLRIESLRSNHQQLQKRIEARKGPPVEETL